MVARCSAGCSWLSMYGLFVMNFMDLKFEPFHLFRVMCLISGLFPMSQQASTHDVPISYHLIDREAA